MAVADRVRIAELDHRDRRQRRAAVEGEPEALPAGAGELGGPEVLVELRRAVRLGRALDRLERDLANAAAGARSRPPGVVEDRQSAAAGAGEPRDEGRTTPRPRTPA
jgi:hypothetical protein